jgi:hypothetical protein
MTGAISMQPTSSPAYVDLEIESTEHPERFARRLATVVNGSPFHLSRVVIAGTVVYPTGTGILDEAATLRVCRFALRRAGAVLDGSLVESLVARVRSAFPTVEHAGGPIGAERTAA